MTGLADDVVAIANVKALYCAAVDRLSEDEAGARDALRAIFLPEVTADYGYDPLSGAEDLIAFLRDAIAGNSEWRTHMLHTPLVVVDGDNATGDWTVMVHLKRRDGGPVDLVLGRYSDSFRRTPEGWRIAHVRFSRQG